MMSIRGLIFDDPRGTQGIVFSAMVFESPDHTVDGGDSQGVDTEPERHGHPVLANNV